MITQLDDGTHHGATLSSFTSISLSPPLVSFSLRLPSRLATALQTSFETSSPTSTTTGSLTLDSSRDDPESHPQNPTTPPGGQRFTVSLLSKPNESLAHTFSQARAEHENMIRDVDMWEPDGPSGLPFVKHGLGALGCRVVGWVPLTGLGDEVVRTNGVSIKTPEVEAGTRGTVSRSRAKEEESGETGSMLFLARVEEVVQQIKEGEDGAGIKPLVYENQRYVTTQS